MTEEEKMALGMFYTVDEERKVIIYDPKCNNYGKWDYNLDDSTKNMAEIAAREKMPVEACFNDTVFQIKPGMSTEDGIKAYEEAREKAWEEYKKTPEYKAKQIAAAKEKAERKAKEAADNELIKDEVLDVSGFKHYFEHMVEINSKDKYGKGIIDYAVRWGKLMQAEMKKQGLDHLTPELVENTDRRADIYGMSGLSASFGRNLLIFSWKHGEELAKINGYNMIDVAFMRAVKSDRAKEFCDKYKPSEPKDFEDAQKKGGQVIAAILQDETLIRKFYEKLSDPKGFSEEKMAEYIPVLKLPDNDLRTLYDACDRAINIVKETKTKTNDGHTI